MDAMASIAILVFIKLSSSPARTGHIARAVQSTRGIATSPSTALSASVPCFPLCRGEFELPTRWRAFVAIPEAYSQRQQPPLSARRSAV
jgi:hypothetical protein